MAQLIYENESINEIFEDDSKFIGEFRCQDYKVIRGYIGGLGDELRLYYTKFDPTIKRASICIVHGFGEHQGRFLHIADFMAKSGFVVHLIDLRGFGYSGGSRGSQTIPQLHMDLEVLLRQVSKDLPLFLYGHAMGALLIITLLLRNPTLKIAGVIVTSPVFSLPIDRKIQGIKYWLVKIFGQYLEDFVINTKQNVTALTKNNFHIQHCFNDKLMMPFLGIPMAQSIIITQQLLAQKRQYFKDPILIFHGKQNIISSYKDSVKFYQRCGSLDKQLKLFENGYHELQHDEEYEELKVTMLGWCNDRIQKSKPFGIFNKLNYGLPSKQSHLFQRICILILSLIYCYYIQKYYRIYGVKSNFNLPILPILIWISRLRRLKK